MKVSIIIPMYKVEKYIEECLVSVLSQKGVDFEVICVDDASPDGCDMIVQRYQSEHDNLRLIINDTNMGLSSARNIGLIEAKGDFVWFVDSDDYIEEDCLASLTNKMMEDCLDILYFNKTYFRDEDGERIIKCNDEKKIGWENAVEGKELFAKFMSENCFKSMNAYTQFFRKDFLIDNNLKFFDGIVHEDYLFFFQCAMKARRVANMDKSNYYYRLRNDSITGVMNPLRKQSIFVNYCEVIDFWKNHSFNEKYSEAIGIFASHLYRQCVEYRDMYSGSDRLQFLDDACKCIYDNFMNCNYKTYVSISEEEMDRIKKGKSVWIYGTGKVAKELMELLHKLRISIDGVLVTKKDIENSVFYGWKVYEINEAPIPKDAIIIIASGKKFKAEMENTVTALGYTNFVHAVKN
ncbi:MAG: glycosyltransferase [Lachnospiraceae bacterium]|jgi:glycosyltransferase involved in cell wall biosynthesis|nr:glycosyltransferase [Lachnospiraceae bacterium]